MTQEQITKMEAAGFKRWTKGGHDRLYINATSLGLRLAYYKTGNISSAWFNDVSISNREGGRLKMSKTYMDVKTGKVYSDDSRLEEAARKIIETVMIGQQKVDKIEKKYEVTVEFHNMRKNSIVVWASDETEAIRLALKWWGNPTIYNNIEAKEEK